MNFHSFPISFFRRHHSFLKEIFILACLMVLVLGSQGCSGSDDDTTKDRPESPSLAVQETPESQEMTSTLSETEQEKAMADPKPQNVQNIHQEVQDQLTHATQAVEKAEHLLQRAPTGKGSDLALAALQEELQSAHILLQNGQAQFNDQKFEMAKADASQAKGKADKVIQQIEQAMDAFTRHSP